MIRRIEITVIERNGPDDTFGWGVVFSDETLRNLEGADPLSKQEILESFAHWDDIDIHFKGRVITSGGHGFCGIERRHLLNILQRRAMALGVELIFQRELDDVAAFPDADLIVAADGINSRVRGRYAAHFKPTIDVRKNKFIWLGTHRMFQAFTFIFVETAYGWFQAHAYRFNHDTSTFIVETTEPNWRAAGLDQLDTAGTIGFCERLFAALAAGTPADGEHEPSARIAMAQLPARGQRELGDGQCRADGRCRPFRAFLHRLRHQTCAGGCDRAGTRVRHARNRRAGRTCRL